MKKIFCIAMLCALFVSCEKNIGPEPENQASKYACELPASYVNGKQAWVPGDKILVHGEYSKDQVIFTLTPADISDDGKTCYVSVAGIAPYEQKIVKSKFYAAYPADLVSNSSQCKDINSFKGTNALLMSGYDNGKKFVMESRVGGVAFTVSGDFDAYELYGNNGEILGYTSLTSQVNTNSKLYAKSRGTNVYTVKGKLVADGNSLNHVCFPDQPVLTDGFYMVLYKGGNAVKRFYTEDRFEVKRSQFIDLGDITSKLQDYNQAADSHVS